MSVAAWMNAADDTSVGTATIEADDELFTIADHGLEDGERVVLSNLTGGAVGTVAAGGVYWVRDTDTNTFAISLTKDGIPITFDADGGADVDRYQPTYTASEMRRLFSGLLWPGDYRFGAREGVLYGISPQVSVSGTTWTVHDGIFVIDPGLSSTSGPYIVAHPEESGSFDPADGSNDRIDAVDIQIQDDDEDLSGQRRARLVYSAGTPAGDPDPPAATANSLRLATFLVSAGGSPSPSVDTEAPLTAVRFGVLYARDESEEPPADGLVNGLVWNADEQALKADTGAGWGAVGSAKGYQYWQTVYYNSPGVDPFDPDDYPGARGAAIRCVAGGGAGGGAAATGADQSSCGGGGQGGSTAWSFHTWDEILTEAGGGTIDVTVGAGGTGVSGDDGNNGGTSSFGSLVSAGGGEGGTAASASGTPAALSGATGTATKVGQIVSDGSGGGAALRHAGGDSATIGGHGGNSIIGGGARASAPNLASNAEGPGGGGGGAANRDDSSAQAGGNGFSGRVIVDIYV